MYLKKAGYLQGLGNLVGSFFSCMPISASLSRTLIQQTVGGHTQLASLISCAILVCVLLWIGPFFQPLPRVIISFIVPIPWSSSYTHSISEINLTTIMTYVENAQCILASIIVVALKGMLMKVTDFVKFWRLDKTDAGIWAVTFMIVVLFDVEYGLLVGVLLCIGRLLVLAMRPYMCKLALAPGTELYLDARRYKGVWKACNLICNFSHYSISFSYFSPLLRIYVNLRKFKKLTNYNSGLKFELSV